MGRSCNSTVGVMMHQAIADEQPSFSGVVKEGFLLRWVVGKGWCNDYVNSGGRCGFDSLPPDSTLSPRPTTPATAHMVQLPKRKGMYLDTPCSNIILVLHAVLCSENILGHNMCIISIGEPLHCGRGVSMAQFDLGCARSPTRRL